MGKIRVHELSKQIGVSNKEIINAAKEYGIVLKSHASAIEEVYAEKIKKNFLKNKSDNGSQENEKTEVKEEVKVYKSESGQEVVQKRKGSKVVLRKKKKVEEKTDEIEEDKLEKEVKAEVTTDTAEIEIKAKPEPKKVKARKKETAEPEDKGLLQEETEIITKTDDAVTDDTEAEIPVEEPLPDEEREEDAKVIEQDEAAAAKPAEHKRKKSKRLKISKEEIIDEDTLEELRRAFRTKLPTRKKEYVVEDKKFRSRQGDPHKRDKPQPAASQTNRQSSVSAKGRTVETDGKETVPSIVKKPIKIGESVTVGELAKKMSIKAVDVIKKLMQLGTPATINQNLDSETAAIVAAEYGYEVEVEQFLEEDLLIDTDQEENLTFVDRPPVVTVMGHVDHGKTTLLDSIRKTSVVEGEAGGITQHIGAYTVSVNDKTIVFVDTPGHEAFTSMRARGASITDIVILVVAADDGVMPQTIEAIDHAKAAEVPIIVAVNKIDKDNAEPEKIKRQLSEHGLISEEWGGDTLFAELSAKTKEGIDELLDLIILQADVLELKAVAEKRANGVVLEAKLDKGRGAVSTVLVTEGTLSTGDLLIAGTNSGKVRALSDENGKAVKFAGPSIPVEVMGLSGVPTAGERFYVLKNEKAAREIISHREEKIRESLPVADSKMSLEQLFENLEQEEIKELFLIIKADTQGSAEALKESVMKLSGEKCKVNVLHSGVGGINETDISLASASNAIVVGFNVRPDANALKAAEKEGVSLELHNIIYDIVNRIKDAMEGLLEPILNEKIDGHAEVKEIFNISRIGTIAGCMVTDGFVNKESNIRVLRDSVLIFDGKIDSLRRFKDDVKEVQNGYECGIGVQNYNDIKVGDTFEFYSFEEIKQKL